MPVEALYFSIHFFFSFSLFVIDAVIFKWSKTQKQSWDMHPKIFCWYKRNVFPTWHLLDTLSLRQIIMIYCCIKLMFPVILLYTILASKFSKFGHCDQHNKEQYTILRSRVFGKSLFLLSCRDWLQRFPERTPSNLQNLWITFNCQKLLEI